MLSGPPTKSGALACTVRQPGGMVFYRACLTVGLCDFRCSTDCREARMATAASDPWTMQVTECRDVYMDMNSVIVLAATSWQLNAPW